MQQENRHVRWLSPASVFCAACALYCGTARGEAILTESSVWRTHVTWGPSMCMSGSGLKPGRSNRQLDFMTASPPAEWVKPDFDDTGWGLWRETHAPRSMAGSKEPLYDTWQYGVQQSSFMRRRCLRGKFFVDDPAGVKGLGLTVVYRGGAAVFVNGQQISLGNLTKDAQADPGGVAEVYPKEFYCDPSGKRWELVNGSVGTLVFKDSASLENFNRRMRKLTVEIPATALRKGVNVVALDVRSAPYPEEVGFQDWWNSCGAAAIELRGEGGVRRSVDRPPGAQVWAVSQLLKVGPFGNITSGRVGNGRQVLLWNFPLCWTGEAEGVGRIRLVGARNGVFAGQVVVSSAGAIKGLKAVSGDLAAASGSFRIPASSCRIAYMAFPAEPPSLLTDPSISQLDALLDDPPSVVAALPARPFTGPPDLTSRGAGVSWSEGGATVPVWLLVKVPKDAPEGEYSGTLTVSADGLKPVAVPVSLTVHGYTLPDPAKFTPHVALVHSPDTLTLKYRVPLWSDAHFAMVEKTAEFMGELGGSVLFIPLVLDTWLGNSQTMVYWLKEGSGYKHDFRVLDRYLDLMCKHTKPRAACIYVFQADGRKRGAPLVSTLDGGSAGTMPAPMDGPSPAAIAFWKPVIEGVSDRLKKHGVDGHVAFGLTIEGGGRTENLKEVVDLFKAVWPEGTWADLAHFGARAGDIYGVPYGYVMSVWGNESKTKSKKWGASDIPFVLVKHYRGDPVIDLRPVASRGSLYWAVEAAMGLTFWGRGGPGKQTQGIGPLGMDFWNFPAGENGTRYPGSLEGRITNLAMSAFSAAALLAPGPSSPVPTARFEAFREGLQVCEARTLIEQALEGGKLDGALAKRCKDAIKRRMDVLRVIGVAENNAQREGWGWFESGGWEDLAGEMFACAGEVQKSAK